MASNLQYYSCIGTNRISIINDGQTPLDGMLSLFRNDDAVYDKKGGNIRLSQGGSHNDDCLHLFITEGANTFYARIVPTDIKQVSRENHRTPLDQIAIILLYNEEGTNDIHERHHEQEKFKIAYKWIEGQLSGGEHDSTNTATVQTSILKTCYNNLVRPVWEGSANNVCHLNNESLPWFFHSTRPNSLYKLTTKPHSSGIAFPQVLGNTISKLQLEVKSLRNQNQQLNAEALRWKDTVDKLMGQWQIEKNELTQNFLTLFNEHKARHLETRQKLDALTKQSAKNVAVGTLANRSLPRREREALIDDVDNHDYAVWDKETVERLAAGPKGRKGNVARRNSKADDEWDDASLSVKGDTFRNPHTGVLEISNYKRMFDSDDEEENVMSSKKRKE